MSRWSVPGGAVGGLLLAGSLLAACAAPAPRPAARLAWPSNPRAAGAQRSLYPSS